MRIRFSGQDKNTGIRKKALALVLAFIASFVISVFGLNYNSQGVIGEESYDATLPTISVTSQELLCGRFYGYKIPMDFGTVKGPLIPLDDTRNIRIDIDTYGTNVSSIEIQVNSKDGARNIANTTYDDLSRASSKSFDLTLSALIEPDEEYIMTTVANTEYGLIYYYSRLLLPRDCHEMGCLEFARYFSDTALSDEYDELATYMEPKYNPDPDVSRVTINSSLNDVGWKNFPVIRTSEPEIEFSEITSNYTSVNLKYQVVSDTEGGTHTYSVDEYYRMRYGQERIFLLDFRRNLTRNLTESGIIIDEEGLLLGQNSDDISFSPNYTGSMVAFIWQGALLEYDLVNSVLTNVFSFGSIGSEDPRCRHDEFDINIINIDETGNIDYTVSGYMNTGPHEGYSGIAFYRYEVERRISRELRFIASETFPQALMADYMDRIYLTPEGSLYYGYANGLRSAKKGAEYVVTEVAGSLKESFAMSENGRYVASCEGEADTVNVRDLYSGKSVTIPAPEGKKLRVIDFLGEDLVYGTINYDLFTDNNIEENLFPLDSVIIANISSGQGETLKVYSREGSFITSVNKQSSYSLILGLSTFNGRAFIPAGNDSIQNVAGLREPSTFQEKAGYSMGSVIHIKNKDDSIREFITYRDMAGVKISYGDDVNTTLAKADSDITRYYGYYGNEAIYSGYYLSDCINIVSPDMGYCTDSNGYTVWQYGRGAYRRNMDPEYILQTPSENTYKLRGCRLDQMLSYVYKGMGVFVNEGRENPVIITGYDSYYITIYEMDLGMTNRLLIDDATNLFENSGNYFTVHIIN